MKISVFNNFLTLNFKRSFKKLLFVFGFLFLGAFSQSAYAQTVSVENDQNGLEGSLVNGRFEVVVEPFFDGDVVVDYTVQTSSTAISGTDFSPLSGSVTVNSDFFTGGSTTVFVLPIDDSLVEGDETVIIKLSPSNDYDIDSANDEATVIIADDDFGEVSVEADRTEAIEGATVAADRGRFRIRLDKENNTGDDIVVSYAFSGTATYGGASEDFTINGNALTGVIIEGNAIVANGSSVSNMNIIPIDDNLVEGDETVQLRLTGVDGNSYSIGTTDTDTVTVIDNDEFLVSVAASDATANESNLSTGEFTIDLGSINATGSPIVVNYTISGSATADEDYEALSDFVSIPDGEQIAVLTVTPLDDTDIEINETIDIEIESSLDYNVVGAPDNTATVRVIDDDDYVAQITASDGSAAEGGTGVSTGEFTVSLSAPNNTTGPIIVNYNISGTAENDIDYDEISDNAISIPVGEQEVEIEISPINDAIQEGTETVILTLATGTGYILGTSATRTATVEIEDNDQAKLTFEDTPQINENISSGELVFEVVLNIEVVGGTTVNYTFNDDTATEGEDYIGNSGTLIFDGTAGEVQDIKIPIINDANLENTENFIIQFASPSNNVDLEGDSSVIVAITDDDNCLAAPIRDNSISNIFCDVLSGSLNDFTQSTPPVGNPNVSLRWSRDSDPLKDSSYLTDSEIDNIPNAGSFYGFFLDDNGTPNDFDDDCASGTIEVEIILNDSPELDEENVIGAERCGPGSLLLSATPSEGASINWYDSIDSNNFIAEGETFTTPSLNATTTYYVEAIENGCRTARQPVVARIGSQATTGTATNGSICNVAANGLTTIDLDTRLSGADPGVWIFVSGPETNVDISSTNVVDFEGATSGAYIFSYTTTNSTAPCENLTVEVTINVSDCETDDDDDGLLGGQEVVLGTDSTNEDTDGDGINDGDEVGDDIDNPLDEDGDGIIDALDSNTEDADNDGVNDQQDPANNNPCIPNRFNGSCDTDGDGVSDLDEQTNGSDPDDPCDPVATPNCDDPIDLEVLKSVDNVDALIGDTIIFKILLTNLSDRTARAIVVGDLLELGFDFVSADAPEATEYDEVSGNWTISELAAGISLELSITVVVAEQGPYTNTAVLLESIPSDNNPENDEATVELSTEAPEGVDLKIEKEARPDTVLVGDEVEFIIRVTNVSESDVVTDIVVSDLIAIENGFEFVSAESDFNGTYDEITGNWNIPTLNREETATLIIRARVPATGSFTNTANIIRSTPRDGNTENNEATVTVEVIEKSPADPGFLYNQFSPNGNNQNEVLRINRTMTDPVTGVQVEVNLQYKIKIYDRYGNLVFETEKVNDSDVWDGTYEGKESPKGTYFYIMNYSVNNQPAVMEKGWIQLIR